MAVHTAGHTRTLMEATSQRNWLVFTDYTSSAATTNASITIKSGRLALIYLPGVRTRDGGTQAPTHIHIHTHTLTCSFFEENSFGIRDTKWYLVKRLKNIAQGTTPRKHRDTNVGGEQSSSPHASTSASAGGKRIRRRTSCVPEAFRTKKRAKATCTSGSNKP